MRYSSERVERAISNALASVRISGGDVDEEGQRLIRAYFRGLISHEEFKRKALEKALRD